MKKAILILGPPRSGTSLVSHIIHNLGVNFGCHERFVDVQTHTYNPIFFELQSLNALNDEIFAYFSKVFYNFDWLPVESDFDDNVINYFAQKITTFIEQEFTAKETIGLKDPRFCFTLPIWDAVLKRLGYNISYVLARRQSGSVFESNIILNNASSAYNFRLVAQTTLLARQHLVGKTNVTVDYENLLADPSPIILHLCDSLGLDSERISDGCSVIRSDLNHQKDKSSSAIYKYFANVIDSALMSSDEYLRYREVFMAATFEKNRDIVNLNQSLNERDDQLASLTQILKGRDDQLASLTQILKGRDDQLASLTRILEDRDSTIGSLSQIVSAYQCSSSWALTKPYRYIGQKLKSLRRAFYYFWCSCFKYK